MGLIETSESLHKRDMAVKMNELQRVSSKQYVVYSPANSLQRDFKVRQAEGKLEHLKSALFKVSDPDPIVCLNQLQGYRELCSTTKRILIHMPCMR